MVGRSSRRLISSCPWSFLAQIDYQCKPLHADGDGRNVPWSCRHGGRILRALTKEGGPMRTTVTCGRGASVRMTGRVLGAVVAIAIGLAAGAPDAMAAGARPVARPVFGAPSADPVAHDPTLMRQGRYWYSIITGDAGAPGHYLPIKRSLDLGHWTPVGSGFSTPPAWLVAELGRTPADLWAPDVEQAGGEYRLYYAGSAFGTNHSVIGLATSPTLDPDSPRYGWTDRGMVIRPTGADNFNPIYPHVLLDPPGAPSPSPPSLP